jgi:hypothetical protein
MSLFKRRKGLGYVPGPRPRLPDEESGFLRALVFVLAIAAAVAAVVLFTKHR